MDSSNHDFKDKKKNLVQLAYEKIISMMEEKSDYKLELGREYLPEICSEEILEIASDGFPIFKDSTILFLFSLKGFKTEFYKNRVIFSLPDLIRQVNMEKISKVRKKRRVEPEREIRDRLIKSLQSSKKVK